MVAQAVEPTLSDSETRTAVQAFMSRQGWNANRLARELQVPEERVTDWLNGIMAVATLRLKIQQFAKKAGLWPEVEKHPGFKPFPPTRLYRQPPGLQINATNLVPTLTLALWDELGKPKFVRVLGNDETKQLLISVGVEGAEGAMCVGTGSRSISKSISAWATKLGAKAGLHAASELPNEPGTWMVQF